MITMNLRMSSKFAKLQVKLHAQAPIELEHLLSVANF